MAIFRTLARVLLIIVAAVLLHHLMIWAEARLNASNLNWAMPGLTVLLLMLYALLIALPFVPGIEIGLSLLMLNGPGAALPVWSATAFGLMLAFLAGRMVSLTWLQRVFADLHMTRACHLLVRFGALAPEERQPFIKSLLPSRYCNWVVDFRYLNLAVLINIPGNSLIGGGGGIAMISGMSGMFRTGLTLLTIIAATAPVPLCVWVFDWKLPVF